MQATPPHPTHEIIGQWRERLLQNTEFEAKLHAMMARKTGELKKALLLKGGGSKVRRCRVGVHMETSGGMEEWRNGRNGL